MKRALIIMSLIAFTYNFIGAGFIYNAWLYTLKKEVKTKLKEDFGEEATLLKVPKSWTTHPPPAFKWHESDEFRYRGQMYDVVRKEIRGDSIWYYCYRDRAETILLNNLSQYVSTYLHQNPDQQKKDRHLAMHLDKIFLKSVTATAWPPAFKTASYKDKESSPSSLFAGIDPPPPRMLQAVL